MNPRDAGYALAALALDPKGAGALAAKAPRDAAAAVQEILGRHKLDDLKAYALRLRETSGAAFAEVHPSWVASRLLEASQPTLEAVFRNLPGDMRAAIGPELRRYGRQLPPEPQGEAALRRAFDAERLEAFRRAAFPELGAASDEPKDGVGRWLYRADARALETLSRECGLRVVARAFCRIGREDLAKLCHGLPPQDSVRLVSMVVELNEKVPPDELRKVQATHLLLLRSTGISQSLFGDAGLGFVCAAAATLLSESARKRFAYRLPEDLGRRVLDLSAPGALPEESAVKAYRDELAGWLRELQEKGVIKPVG